MAAGVAAAIAAAAQTSVAVAAESSAAAAADSASGAAGRRAVADIAVVAALQRRTQTQRPEHAHHSQKPCCLRSSLLGVGASC